MNAGELREVLRPARWFRIETVALCLMTACVCPADPPPMVCDFPTSCVDSTCCEFVAEVYCAPCPRGTEPMGACSPGIFCGDAGVPTDTPPPLDGGDSGSGCGAVDAGPICRRIDDLCCDSESRYPRMGPDCSLSCEPGYSASPDACVPDPSCEPSVECDEPSECTTTFETCCGTCSEVALSDVISIRADAERDYRDAVCDGDIGCPPCAPPPHPYLVSTCNARQCRALDTRVLPLTQCTADEQCRMRATECCECGADTSPDALIGIRIDAEADYLNLVCDSDAICDDCVPIYPDTHEAFCNDVGACSVRLIGDDD